MAMEGKVIAITGGASGIGLATAQIMSKRGATVCIGDQDPEALKTTEEYFTKEKAQFSLHKLDVSSSAEVDAWFAEIKKRYGRLDGAANVAGITGKVHGQTKLEDMPNEDWQRILDVNLNGTMYCMRAELKMIADGGSIVNVASIHGLKGEEQTRLPVPTYEIE
jgi:NAD(P)-dependent dehydrogenase (short-subunit alcohol dehydrogenase family)